MSMQPEISKVWKVAEKRLPTIRNVDMATEVGHVLRYLSDRMPDLYSGSPVPVKTEQDIIQVARDLSNRAAETSVQARFSFLCLGFEIGNTDYGWEVPLVPQLVKVKKPHNWATKDNFIRRGAASVLEQAFGRDLERPVSKDPAFLLGQLLFSAVFFGALLDKKWLEPFLCAVLKRDYFQHNEVLWVEMVKKSLSASSESLADSEVSYYTKRFFPDNFTRIFLYRLLGDDSLPIDIKQMTPWSLVRSYLQKLPHVSASQLPDSLDEFLKLALSRNLLLPGSMLAYATGKLKSTSLPIEPWLRCISGKAVAVTKSSSGSRQIFSNSINKIIAPKRYSMKRQELLFNKLIKKINPKDKQLSKTETAAILDQYLTAHKHEMSPAFQLMILWGKQLLGPRISYLERRGKKEAVKPSTIRRYFRAVGVPFLLAATDQNLTTIDPLELALIYEEAISNRQADYMAPQCLVQFHGFLEAFFGLPPIESIELKSSTFAETNQNANLITLDLYSLVLKGLGWGRVGLSRWQRLRIIAWIICYRCGLRPAEVLNMQVHDFQLIAPDVFEIVIRISPKTERGKRRIPASLLMDKEEIHMLLEYLEQRRNELGLFGDNNFLAHPEQKSGRLYDQDIYEATRSLLRSITHDDNLRLYHARHTYNSALHVQFLLKGRHPFGPGNVLNLGISVKNDLLFRNVLEGNENWGRKDQHVQAIIVGHMTPEMTNQYYNHLNDMLLGILVQQPRDLVPVSLKSIMLLSGAGQSWANELMGKHGRHSLAGLVKAQAKKYSDVLVHPLLKHAIPLALPKLEEPRASEIPPFEKVASQEMLRKLKRGKNDWDLAYNIYETVRKLNGKRLKMAADSIREINQQMSRSDKRWSGLVYTSITELKTMLVMIVNLGVAREYIRLVHHPRRGQSAEVAESALSLWQKRIDMPLTSWITGEPANKSVSKKGVIEIRIVATETDKAAPKRQPNMNNGFEISMELLKEAICTFGSWEL